MPYSRGKRKGADVKNNQIRVLKTPWLKGFIIFAFSIYLFCFFGLNPANAGFFSFLEKIWDENSADSNKSQDSNSQTVPLLHAALSSEPIAATGGGSITIIGQSALLSEVGPLGSIADVEDKSSPDQISIYVVREGDNLAGIAKMFNVSVNTILWANNLSRGDLIQVGQTLVILPISGVRYEVKSGDTIESIAKKWKGDIDEIIQFNDLSRNQKLAVGTIIIIPNGEAPVASSSYRSPSNPYKGGSGPSYTDYYVRPVSGGRRSQGIHGYNGIDLAASCGTPIVASASGDVIIARSSGWNAGYGSYIVISHSNGTQTLYAHMNSVIVSPGWHVTKGQIIGYIGLTGRTTGCHVHFEVRGAKNPF